MDETRVVVQDKNWAPVGKVVGRVVAVIMEVALAALMAYLAMRAACDAADRFYYETHAAKSTELALETMKAHVMAFEDPASVEVLYGSTTSGYSSELYCTIRASQGQSGLYVIDPDPQESPQKLDPTDLGDSLSTMVLRECISTQLNTLVLNAQLHEFVEQQLAKEE